MTKNKKFKALALVLLVVAVMATGSRGHVAAATNSSTMPNLSNFSGSASGNQVRLVVSNPYATNSLNATQSIVKIYSTSPTLNISIFSFDHCNTSPDNDSNVFSPTTYKLTSSSGNENDSGVLATSIRTNAKRCTYDYNSAYNISLPALGATDPRRSDRSTVLGHEAFYVYYLTADITGDGVNSFSVMVNNPGSLIGYSRDSGDRFALQNRTSSSSSTSSFNIPFAADCSSVSTSTTLYWSDDDWGGIQQDRSSYYFRVKDVTTGGFSTIIGNGQNTTVYYPTGGQNISQTVTVVNFNPDHKYEWQWSGIVDSNGIQFQLPFDSINFNTTCPDSPVLDGFKITNTGLDIRQDLTNGNNAGPTYPFSDDRVVALRASDGAYVHGARANYFNFKDCNPYTSGCRESTAAYDNHLLKGVYNFTTFEEGTANLGWVFKGYTICNATTSPSTCNSAYLNDESRIRDPSTDITLADGNVYHSRFIYEFDNCLNVPGIQPAGSVPADKERNPGDGNCYYIKPIIDGQKVEQNTGDGSGPYRDNDVQIRDGGGSVINSSGAPQTFVMTVNAGDVPVANYSVTQAGAGVRDGTWASRGFTLCDEALPTCTIASANNSAGRNSAGTSISLQANHRYRVHWLYEYIDMCTRTNFGPTTGEDGFPFDTTIAMDFSDIEQTPDPNTDTLSVAVSSQTPIYPYAINGGFPNATLNSSPVSVTLPFGSYTATIKLTGPNAPNGTITCTKTVTITKHSYFRAYGGDIISGGQFGQNGYKCATRSPYPCGNIYGVYNDAKNGGAGGELGVLALLAIDNVASADLRFGTARPNPKTGLDFGNAGGALGRGTNGYVAPDYFSQRPTNPADYHNEPSNLININPGNNFSDEKPTYANPGGGTVVLKTASGSKVQYRTTIYVNGNIQINDDIEYNDTTLSRDTPDARAYLTVIVKGNIYIAPGVTNLNGFYVAQPLADGSKGIVYTCQTATGSPDITSIDYLNNCGNKLTITGAVVAQKVVLQRITSGLKDAVANEPASSPNIAEVFQFTPEMYTGHANIKIKGAGKYDSIKSLPPIL